MYNVGRKVKLKILYENNHLWYLRFACYLFQEFKNSLVFLLLILNTHLPTGNKFFVYISYYDIMLFLNSTGFNLSFRYPSPGNS